MPGILVVDDDKLLRWPLSEVLKRAGYRVHEAATGEDGRAAIPECDPDLVLLDVRLADVNGFTVLQAIRQARPDLRVLMVTADPTAEAARRAFRPGACAHPAKPCGSASLLPAVSQALQGPTPPGETSG